MAFSLSGFQKKSSPGRPAGLVGKIVMSLFFGFFLGMGLLAAFFLAGMVFRSLATYQWQEVPATILRSAVREDAGGKARFSLEVRYRYQWNGHPHTSTRYSLQEFSDRQYETVQKAVEALPVGQTVTCLVDPSQPEEAILRRPNPLQALFLFLPLVFVVIGGGGIYWIWFGRAARTGAVSPASPGAPGRRTAPTLLIGGIFTLVGAGILIFWLAPAMLKAQATRHWTETPCTVLSSRVESHRGDDSTTYSVDIFYRYEVNGREYKSNRYRSFSGSSSGRAGKVAIVRQYPPGSQQVCYVNPEDATEAVLRPGLGWEALFALIPAAFLLVGLSLLIFGRRGAAAQGMAAPTAGGEPASATGPVPLPASASPLGRLVGICIGALFWNGIVSVFVWQVVEGFQRGNPKWFLTLMMVPFVLVGLGLLAGVGYYVLALANPRSRLTLDPGLLTPGVSLTVTWKFRGAVHRMKRLRITLEGREMVTYRRGTSTYSDKETFASLPVAEVSSRMEMRHGTARLQLPAETMPGFDAPNNKLVWCLKVHGEIARWPDVKEEYGVTIRPAENASSATVS